MLGILLILSINEYIVQYSMIDDYTFSDFRIVYFDMQSYTGLLSLFFPLFLIILVIDKWHNLFKNGNIKNYLTRISYNDLKKKVAKSIALTALWYPIILLIYFIISLILSGGRIEQFTISNFDNRFEFNLYQYFPIYMILHCILLYIAGLATEAFALLFLNRVKSKIGTVLFSNMVSILKYKLRTIFNF